MAELDRDALRQRITLLRRKIEKYRAKGEGIGEENTKATLIAPLLESLGWDTTDWEVVRHEYKSRRQDKPVDYALLIGGQPRLFVEAKALRENLENRKWASQILTYAVAAGVEWCVLTNGNEYHLYNTHAQVPLEKKLFRKVSIADEAGEGSTLDILCLLSRSELDRLSDLWEAYHVDRQVRNALQRIAQDAPIGLLRLIRDRAPKLRSAAVRASLKRVRVEIDFSVDKPAPGYTPSPRRKPWEHLPVSLSNLIDAGLIKPPVKMEKNYKGTILRATILPDGKVEFEGTPYNSLSTAATHAVATVSGRRMAQDGWQFWKLQEPNTGQWKSLHTIRKAFLEARHAKK